eukprot:GDKJ01056842.1.p1 GENE.GDKJ01056842.1~~GDKJ01056842.1.p1  ORF type:complete len:607 (+),score=157.74 GDKJ01056842.1:26-1846(+)
MSDKLRICIVNADKCKPKKCRQECKQKCPVVLTGKLCIEVKPSSKVAFISEILCIGCGICVKRCPFEALNIINLPKDMSKDVTQRYGANTFKLHRLPIPRAGQVLGLVGSNGIGKSSALKILAGKVKPNLGNYDNPPEWTEILQYFRGSELQSYFTKLLENKIKAVIKPQYVDQIPLAVKGVVYDLLAKKDDTGRLEEYMDILELNHIKDRTIDQLSGGELQRFAIGLVSVGAADMFMFDEPSSYLDIRQRLRAAHTIRSVLNSDRYLIVVEHDLSVLDYLSDYICCLWGTPGVYGVVTLPASVREGINHFLDGFIPSENMRIRPESINFRVSDGSDIPDDIKHAHHYKYPKLYKKLGSEGSSFELNVEPGGFSDSEIIVLLGQNGTGKSTFIRMLAGNLKPDEGELTTPDMSISFKPQTVKNTYDGSVRTLFLNKIRAAFTHPQFTSDVIKPLQIESIMDQEVSLLSGGELQRVAIIVALGKPADIYLLDEPSAYLDSEQRIAAARVIKRFIINAKKTAFIVEHDFIMATYMADRVIVYEGAPGVKCTANSPESLVKGMNKFLAMLEITFRRDPTNYRPRINKADSVKDREQKISGNFFMVDSSN